MKHPPQPLEAVLKVHKFYVKFLSSSRHPTVHVVFTVFSELYETRKLTLRISCGMLLIKHVIPLPLYFVSTWNVRILLRCRLCSLKMGPLGFLETSVNNSESRPCNVAGD